MVLKSVLGNGAGVDIRWHLAEIELSVERRAEMAGARCSRASVVEGRTPECRSVFPTTANRSVPAMMRARSSVWLGHRYTDRFWLLVGRHDVCRGILSA